MILLTSLLSILFLIGPTTIEGVELGNNNQTHLEVNLVDQCMANPETGPQGRYYSAMRFKFLVNASKECNGSIFLCYPGQLDPAKASGLSIPTTHWAIRNLTSNSIAEKCDEIRRKECHGKSDDCEMQDTPWHGIQIKIDDGGEQIELKLSIGGGYTFPLTNFTLMLHNNAVHDEADPAAFLVNDFDNQDLCIKQDVFPIAGQSKPVVIKIPLHDNEAKYTEWKKNVGQDGKLMNFQHLFRLSWDMLPKTQLDQDDEKLYIWMVNDVNATCNTRVFFFDRMQTEATNKDICPDKDDTMDIHEYFINNCPNGIGWKPIKAANLTDQYGSELVVRVGFLEVFEENDEDELSWNEYRKTLMRDKYPLDFLSTHLAYFPFGEFHYASLENDLELYNMTVDRLEAFVFNCTNYIISTRVRRRLGKPKAVHPMLDWSKDFALVNQCKEKQKLLVRHTVNISHASWDHIVLEAKNIMTGLSKEQRNIITDNVTLAYKYKFNGRKSNVETADNYKKVRLFGRFLSNDPDAYKPQTFQSIKAKFIKITAEMVKNHTSRRDNSASQILIKKSCADVNYCNYSLGKKFCEEEENGVYECYTCPQDNCNGLILRICMSTPERNRDNSTLDTFYVPSANGILSASFKYCDEKQEACLSETCRTKNDSFLVSLNCARSFHCNSKQSAKVEKECEKDYRCHLCEKDLCNGGPRPLKCMVTEGFKFENSERTEKTEEVGYIPADDDDESQISDGSQLFECPLFAPNSRCLTEICYTDENTLVRKGCVQADYCDSKNSTAARNMCEKKWDGYYDCKLCQGLDYCNGFPRQRCWNTKEFVTFDDIANYEEKDFTCSNKHAETQCATEYCKKPTEFVVFGLYVLQYECPYGINFFVPRFDGAILGASDTEDGKNVTHREGNMVQLYTIDHEKEQYLVDAIVDKDNLMECFYDLHMQRWVNCKTWEISE